jgi:hypothetical protein
LVCPTWLPLFKFIGKTIIIHCNLFF